MKHIIWPGKASTKYIPVILAISGAVLACVSEASIQMETIVSGVFTGLASTGLHQAFRQIIENGSKE